MFKNIQEMLEYVHRENVEIIDFKVTDMQGTWHRLSITRQKLKEDIMTKGIGFDGSSYGFTTVDKSDMAMVPDVTTCYIDPTKAVKTIACIADIYTIENNRLVRYEDDPRYVAEKAEKLILSSGIADEILLGPEFEFYVLDHVSFDISNNHMEVRLDSEQAEWNASRSDVQNLGLHVRSHGAYHLDSPFDRAYDLRTETVLAAERIGVPVKYHHAENGGPGQCEIEVEFASIREMGDRSMKLRHLLRNLAEKQGKVVTFMPKPFGSESGSGLHVHLLLKNKGQWIMYDKDGYSGLSQTALYMIGGLLTHAKSLCAITNPSTNSYKRLVPGFEAPVTIGYATSNRSAVIRIPGYAVDETEKRFEYRSPDATSNPYLAYAALMLAAYDGIKNKIDPSGNGFGPFDFNLYDLSKEDQARIKGLPTSIPEAFAALKEDRDYLLKEGVFSAKYLESLEKRLMQEHSKIQRTPHPLEFDYYFNR
ncbi:MAG: type I glutamate--ammonia ligase [Candidatus Izemoplasmatales bacterium]